jgi:hypothetical protein
MVSPFIPKVQMWKPQWLLTFTGDNAHNPSMSEIAKFNSSGLFSAERNP